jgi:hypothetical protein
MSTIFTTDLFYPPGANNSSSNYTTSTEAVGAARHVTINTLGTGGSSGSGGLGYANYFDTNSFNKDYGVIRADRDVIIDGRSMRDFMESMEQRLAILVPDPKKLAHFQSLQKAYAHYKTLEALCEIPTGQQDE